MGCVASFNKSCDVCICLLKEYKGEIKKNNFIISDGKKGNNKSTFYKSRINETFIKLNKDVKYQHEVEQLKELNDMYQQLLSLDSERNKNIYNENDFNNLNQVN